MAKGIIVVDVPKACGYCACCKHDALYTRYCGVNKRDLMNDIDWNLEKPDWCPIKPAPERADHEDYCDNGRYDKGWNDCLDRIFGREK